MPTRGITTILQRELLHVCSKINHQFTYSYLFMHHQILLHILVAENDAKNKTLSHDFHDCHMTITQLSHWPDTVLPYLPNRCKSLWGFILINLSPPPPPPIPSRGPGESNRDGTDPNRERPSGCLRESFFDPFRNSDPPILLVFFSVSCQPLRSIGATILGMWQ